MVDFGSPRNGTRSFRSCLRSSVDMLADSICSFANTGSRYMRRTCKYARLPTSASTPNAGVSTIYLTATQLKTNLSPESSGGRIHSSDFILTISGGAAYVSSSLSSSTSGRSHQGKRLGPSSSSSISGACAAASKARPSSESGSLIAARNRSR